MATVVYDGLEGFDNIGETAKEVLKGGLIGAATGFGVVFITNKIDFLNRMNPLVKGVVQLGVVIGTTALAKDKVSDEVATAMGIGGASVVLGSLIGSLLHKQTPAVQGLEGYGDAVAPVIEEVEGYGDAVTPVVEEVEGYGELDEDEDGVYVEVE